MVDKHIRARDPFFQREADKYPNPVPSREFILQYLEEVGHPITANQLIDDFGIVDEDELDAFHYRLKAMLRDAQLMRDRRYRYCLIDKIELIPGVVIGHPDGHGFVKADRGGKDFFLSPKQMRQVMHGDRVLMRQVGEDSRGRPEGAIFEVIARNTEQVVGRFYAEHGISFVEPDNKRFCQDIHIIPEGDGGAKEGQYVLVEIVQQPSQRAHALGRVISIIGEHMAPGMEIDVAIHSYGLPNTWSELSQREAHALEAYDITQQPLDGRVDIRHFPLVTIDGEDARDFDDAVYCEPNSTTGGYRLLVAIADVSHYVKKDAPLDTDAVERGNSVYFPERVIPMLPEVLSNELCSLKPKVDRFCMVCDMQVSASGRVTDFEFYPAVMHSQARLTYTQVAAMLEPDADAELKTTLCAQYASVLPHLQHLHGLFALLFQERSRRGAIDFDTQETRIIFSDDKKIQSIVPTQRNIAHRLIEECMLAANVCAARHLLKHKIPTLYRIHESPDPLKLATLREFLGEFGLHLMGGDEPAAHDFADVLSKLGDRPEASLIQTVMLRSLQQARYATDNVGHFGLAYDAYAHFTSPIRRYPDLLVHRAIRHLYEGGVADNFAYSFESMAALGEHCSTTERRADEATRDVNDWLKCEYMLDRVGEEYAGVITSVTNFGLFVRLDAVFVEGLVHITALPSDYYQFDAKRHALIGERTRKVFRLGDVMHVRVIRVDLNDRKIDFELTDAGQGSARRAGAAPAKASKKEPAKPVVEKQDDEPTRQSSKKRRRRRSTSKKAQEQSGGLTSSPAQRVTQEGTSERARESKRQASQGAGDKPRRGDAGSDTVKPGRSRSRSRRRSSVDSSGREKATGGAAAKSSTPRRSTRGKSGKGKSTVAAGAKKSESLLSRVKRFFRSDKD